MLENVKLLATLKNETEDVYINIEPFPDVPVEAI